MRHGLVAVTVFALFASNGADALAVVLCAKPRGDGTFSTTVKIRETCRPVEIQLDPVALGLQGPAGPQGVPGPTGAVGPSGPPGPGLTLRDANGTLGGLVSDTAVKADEFGAPLTELSIVRSDGPRLFAFESRSDDRDHDATHDRWRGATRAPSAFGPLGAKRG